MRFPALLFAAALSASPLAANASETPLELLLRASASAENAAPSKASNRGHKRSVRKDGRAVTSIPAPRGFIPGHLQCARNVEKFLRQLGRRGTGSALARSYIGHGKKVGPVPGATAVWRGNRGPQSGHANVVAGRCANGEIAFYNPSQRSGGWRLMCGYRGSLIGYWLAPAA